jgi:hypothetical protein
MPTFPPFRDKPVSSHHHEVLRNAGMADAKCIFKGVNIMFSIPQFFDYANAMGVR